MNHKILLTGIFTLAMMIVAGCSNTDTESTTTTTESETTPSTNIKAMTSESITVTLPQPGDMISSPFTVEGTTTADVDRVYLEGQDVNGDIIVETYTYVDEDTGEFSSQSLYYFLGGGDVGSMHVFTKDTNDEEMERTVVPVVLE